MAHQSLLLLACGALLCGLASGARLDNLYGAPAPAASYQGGGGDANVLRAPQQFGQQAPANQYLPPSTGGGSSGYPSVAPLGQRGGQQPGYQQFPGQQPGFSGGGGGGGGYNPQPASGPAFSGASNALQPSYQGAAPGNYPQTTPIPILRYENVNNGDGSYRFDYATGNGIQHQEEGFLRQLGPEKSEQVVSGGYSYTAPDGQQYSVQYKADANGFQPVGDHLPTPPPLPPALQEAYDLHARLHAEAAARPKNPAYQDGAPQQGSYPQQSSYYPQPQPAQPQYQPQPQQPQQQQPRPQYQQPQQQQPQPQFQQPAPQFHSASSPNAIQGYPSAPANQYLPPARRQPGFNPSTGYTY